MLVHRCSLLQVNSPACSLLYSTIGSWLRPTTNTLLLDVCCGTGTIGISLARRVKAVIGVEVEATAVEDAKVNSSLNGLDNCIWVAGKAEDVMQQVLQVRPGLQKMESRLWGRPGEEVSERTAMKPGLETAVVQPMMGGGAC